MTSRKLLIILIAAVAVLSSLGHRTVTGQTTEPAGDGRVVVLNDDGSPRDIDDLRVTADAANRTIEITAADSTDHPFWACLNESWVESTTSHAAFVNASFEKREYHGRTWLAVRVDRPVDGLTFLVQDFRPKVGQPAYSLGSPGSIALERPMFISLEEVPRVELRRVTKTNENGTWTEDQPVPVLRLGINFTDEDTSGQTVALSRAWLGALGLADPFFRYADGTPIANTSDASSFFLHPEHFSVLYVFTTNEGFTKESDQANSNLYWDSSNRNVYLLSDRRDPAGTNERMVAPSAATYDETTSFTVRATWQTTQQGNWQWAVPVFFMASSNTKVDMANSVYVLYASRDSNLGQTPYYYLRYRDSTGSMRVDSLRQGILANVQLEFLLDYNGYTRTLTLAIYDSLGASLGSASYMLPAGQKFSVGEVGTAAWGASSTYEPATIAKVDNVYFDANMARNGNYEVDADSNSVPDNWQQWIWSDGPVYRSSDRAKYGTWSVKITDSSATADYGLQTVYMTTSAGKTYAGTTWIWAVSGSYWLCIEFWDASGFTRLSVACKASVAIGLWEFLDLTMTAPSGAAKVDLLVYSTGSNAGTGYFDGAELRTRRSFWSVSHHDGEHATWQQALEFAADLGVSYVRTDLRWASIETGDGVFDPVALNKWRNVTSMARVRGVGLIAILNGLQPSWADCQSGPNCPQSYYDQFQGFCQRMALEFGSDVYYYQILNEMNHQQEVPGAASLLVKSCYQGLLSGESVVAASHKAAFKTIVNAFADRPLWDDWLRAMISQADSGPGIDIAAVDHYPGIWAVGDCNEWSPLDALFRDMADYNKEGALMETGYSSWVWPSGQTDQNNWVSCALPNIKSKATAQNANDPLHPIILANFYDLVDANSGCACILGMFGLLDDLLGQKPAYGTFRTRVSEFGF